MLLRKISVLVLCAALLVAAGCARIPLELQGPSGQPLHDSIPADIEAGDWLRVGGTLVALRYYEHFTEAEMVLYPLNRSGRPLVGDRSYGRALLRFNQFLEPKIYTEGRELTAVGYFIQVELGKIEQQSYSYPVIAIESHRLWKEIEIPDMRCDCEPLFYGPSIFERRRW